MVPGLKNLSYEKRLEHLGPWTLKRRRNRTDLLEVFKMYKGMSTVPFECLFALSTATNTRPCCQDSEAPLSPGSSKTIISSQSVLSTVGTTCHSKILVASSAPSLTAPPAAKGVPSKRRQTITATRQNGDSQNGDRMVRPNGDTPKRRQRKRRQFMNRPTVFALRQPCHLSATH